MTGLFALDKPHLSVSVCLSSLDLLLSIAYHRYHCSLLMNCTLHPQNLEHPLTTLFRNGAFANVIRLDPNWLEQALSLPTDTSLLGGGGT